MGCQIVSIGVCQIRATRFKKVGGIGRVIYLYDFLIQLNKLVTVYVRPIGINPRDDALKIPLHVEVGDVYAISELHAIV